MQALLQVPQNVTVITKIYFIFLNTFLFTCMPIGQFPETLVVIFVIPTSMFFSLGTELAELLIAAILGM